MPFDGLPEGLVTDMVKLRIALDGVRGRRWATGAIGAQNAPAHCALGWLLVATDWDRDEAVRLAVEYVYPALPKSAQKKRCVESIWEYNDRGGQGRIERLFANAVQLAEKQAVP